MGGYTAEQLKNKHGDRWRWYAIGTIVITTIATLISSTSINVALSDIMQEFSLSQGEIHWLATGYLAAMTISMLCATWVLDHIGLRNSTLIAIVFFSLISVIGGISNNVSVVFIARFGLGAIAGLMHPMAMYFVFRVFQKNQRGYALGFYGFGIVLAPTIAPYLGGLLVENFSWRYVFYAPVPVTLISLVLVWFFLPVKVYKPKKYPFDFFGLILLSIIIIFSLDAINNLQYTESGFIRRVGTLTVAALALIFFILYEKKIEYPLLNIRLLMRRQFIYAGFSALALGFSIYSTTYLIPVYTQSVLGFSPSDAGLVMLPAGVFLGFTLLASSKLTDITKSKYLLVIGMTFTAAAFFMLFLSNNLTGFIYVASAAVISRIGIGFMMPSVSTGALNQLSIEELSDGSSTISFIRQLGGAYGINVIALILELGKDTSASYLLPLGGVSIAWAFMFLFIIVLIIPVSRLKE